MVLNAGSNDDLFIASIDAYSRIWRSVASLLIADFVLLCFLGDGGRLFFLMPLAPVGVVGILFFRVFVLLAPVGVVGRLFFLFLMFDFLAVAVYLLPLTFYEIQDSLAKSVFLS